MPQLLAFTHRSILATLWATILLGLCAPAGWSRETPSNLTLFINDVSSNAGYLVISLFNRADSFPKQKKALLSFRMPARAGQMQVLLGQLPKGRYAAFVFHDCNSNNRVDNKRRGREGEGIGFSGNPLNLEPTFAETAFPLERRMHRQQIDLEYPGLNTNLSIPSDRFHRPCTDPENTP